MGVFKAIGTGSNIYYKRKKQNKKEKIWPTGLMTFELDDSIVIFFSVWIMTTCW